MRTAFLPLASVLTLHLLIVPSAFATDCDKSIELYNLGTETAELTQKERLFREALALPCRQQPVLAKIHNNLADAYERQGRLNEAMAEYRQAIALDPTLPTPHIGLGDILRQQGQIDEGEVNHERVFLLAQYRSKDELIAALSITSRAPSGRSPRWTCTSALRRRSSPQRGSDSLKRFERPSPIVS